MHATRWPRKVRSVVAVPGGEFDILGFGIGGIIDPALPKLEIPGLGSGHRRLVTTAPNGALSGYQPKLVGSVIVNEPGG